MSSSSIHYNILKYNPEWEKMDLFLGWLSPGKNEQKAMCLVCDVELMADLNLLKVHAKGQRHCIRANGMAGPGVGFYNKRWEEDPEYRVWLCQGRTESKANCSVCDVEMKAAKTVIRNHSKSNRHRKSLEHYNALTQLMDYTNEINAKDPLAGESLFDDTKDNIMEQIEISKKKPETITSLISMGFKRMRRKCDSCESTLVKNREGEIFCVSCDDPLQQESSSIDVKLEDSLSQNAIEVIMQLDEKCENDDAASVIHEVRENQYVECRVQGIDMGEEVQRLLSALKKRLSFLNTIIGSSSSPDDIQQMETIVKILNKLKEI